MALELEETGMVLTDTCRPLIETYQQVRDAPDVIACLLEDLAKAGTDQDSYYAVRDQFNALNALEASDDAGAVLAAQFLYLNSLGYNGVFRLNKSGKFNVPYGDTSGAVRTVEELQASEAVKNSEFAVADFRDVIGVAQKGDVIYCDPPYMKTFASYTANGFGQKDQEDLASALYWAHTRGVSILTTNADLPEIRTLYGWARVVTYNEARSVSQNGAKRGRAPCLVISSPDWEV
jgi:DNA adenine methylase